MTNPLVVMKFGGAAAATAAHFRRLALLAADAVRQGRQVCVVVSAMGNMTDQLQELAREVSETPPRRELDMLLSAGERISVALLAMALDAIGQEAVSFTGSQAGIMTCSKHTDARIVEVRPHRLAPHLSQGKVVIVAGFQGVSLQGEITTLGRGGSDTTAVALGVALDAEVVEFYKDVPGVFNRDPKMDDAACLLSHLSYGQALALAGAGKILHPRCVLLAQNNGMPLHVRPYYDQAASGTWIGLEGHRCQQPQFERVSS